ncbi:MAG TPA: M50 family metallopeptidase [Candidatus Nanoarchaeia archaeon]|nr:M50 family metallopeptidase [Candidatus Nanoarchaeia archaeon]
MPWLFTLRELLDIVLMTFAVGYIFSGAFKRVSHASGYDPIVAIRQRRAGIDWHELKFAMLIVAPGLILHELGHKFVAMAFGLFAEFHAAYFWLIFGVVMKWFGSGFIFFVPAYVSHSPAPPLPSALIAAAGPLLNALLWIIPSLLMKTRRLPTAWIPAATLMAKVNMFLFIFNMLPIPGFDGFHLYRSMWQWFSV